MELDIEMYKEKIEEQKTNVIGWMFSNNIQNEVKISKAEIVYTDYMGISHRQEIVLEQVNIPLGYFPQKKVEQIEEQKIIIPEPIEKQEVSIHDLKNNRDTPKTTVLQNIKNILKKNNAQ
jgi:hypothetical protein